MTSDQSYSEGEFTADELENSAPFDHDKCLKGEAGAALHEEMRGRIEKWEQATGARKRARKPDDAKSFALTLETFLANLVALWLNRVDPTRFLAVGFDKNTYVGLPQSVKAMTTLRDAMKAEGLIEVAPGFLKVDTYEHAKSFGRRTRIRATSNLLNEFERCGVSLRSLKVLPRDALALRKRTTDAAAPTEVQDSVAVIDAVNARLAQTDIQLSFGAWSQITWKRARGDDRDAFRAFAGDETAKVLQRIFTGSWDRGGRIYGGWWMHVPATIRPYLRIDGEPVVEWDYAHLHPSMLFARDKIPLDFDPYTLGDEVNPGLRELGKGTFQRLVNREYDRPMRAASGDKALLRGMTFRVYLASYLHRLAPIQRWFFIGEGMKLQREDSDMAVDVLSSMEAAGIATLPVHDSFIVPQRHSEALKAAMVRAYEVRHGTRPVLKRTDAKYL